MRFLVVLLLLTIPLCAERITPEKGARSFEDGQVKKFRVDTFDFSGDYPDLVNINIDAKKKKNVELLLTGDYPVLESLNYEGSFGSLSGTLTGHFPKLSKINFLCTNCAMNLDLGTQLARSCEMNIRGANENVVLILPRNVGLVIHTRVAVKGKVIPCDGLKKVGKFGVLKKSYVNELAETAPIVLTINIEVAEGHIILKNAAPHET